MSENPGSILIVDDSPENLKLMALQLRPAGYDVATAPAGATALAMVESDPPDLILLDVMMPGLDGYEVCRRLKEDPRSRHIPVVILTALSDRADKLRALQAGADEFLSKPVDRAELLARVGSLLRLKRAYDELSTERATLAAITSSMSDGLLVVGEQNTIRYANRRAAELLGQDPATLVGTAVDSTLRHLTAAAPTTREEREEGTASPAGASPRPSSGWSRVLADAAARTRWSASLEGPPARDLQVELFPLDLPNVHAAGVLLRDVTQERAAERVKDELVSVVSHELRTPLASLVGFAELLLARAFPEEERREFLTIMLEEGRRLTALINDFLDLQRMESGRQTVVPEPSDLPALVGRAVAAAGPDEAHPTVVDIPADLPRVQADPDRVIQVLANLLSNARKFSPDGGEVRVAARTVAPANGLPAVEVSVRDAGLGLPPEALPRLFEKFYRVDNSDRREIKGTGLGLAICRQIVEAHGGRIWAESDGLNRGCCFRFTLPLAGVETAGGDVLVVENDAGFARLLEEELDARRLTAVRAASAEAALARASASPPRAVVLDLFLPGRGGEAALPELRGAIGPAAPIVVVTVKDLGPAEIGELAHHGVAGVFRKGPGVAAQAAGLVRELLDNHAAAVA